MGITGKIITTAAMVLALSAPSFSQDAPTKATVVASVNGTDITIGHVLALASRLPEQYLNISDKDLYAGIIDQLVQQELLSALITEETSGLKLAAENEKRALFASEATENIYDTALTEEAVMAQYNTLYLNAEPILEYNPSHILVKTVDEAKAIIKQLEGGADFAKLAKEKSTGPSNVQGGELGWVGKGQFVPEFETAMLELEAGQISAPVETQFGWHVIKLSETRNQPVPELEAVREGIEEGIRSEALGKRISELETTGKIARNEEIINPSIVWKFELLKD